MRKTERERERERLSARLGLAYEMPVNIADRLRIKRGGPGRISNSRPQYDQSPAARYPSSSPRRSSYSTLSVALLAIRGRYECQKHSPAQRDCY